MVSWVWGDFTKKNYQKLSKYLSLLRKFDKRARTLHSVY